MIRASIAFLASVLTAVQAFSLYFNGQTICFNKGCAIVDSLTAVPPLYFNLAGFVYFQAIFWCLLWGRDGSELWHKIARLLLLAGLCVEAVLVFFQYAIVTVFCSYCMVILAIIVLLNVLSGPRQIIRGMVVFSAVTVACFSLQFRAAAGSGATLDGGSMAIVAGEQQESKLYLFFSSTCPYCEKVIDALREENSCTIRFNPIERIETFSFPGAKPVAEYNHAANLSFLQSLSIKEIPAAVVMDQQTISVLKGEQRIMEYLDSNCRQAKAEDYGGTSSMTPSGDAIAPGAAGSADDACKIEADCDPAVPGEAGKKQ